MKECPACHAKNEEKANFCTACGATFLRTQLEENKDNKKDFLSEKRELAAPSATDVPNICNDSPMTPAVLKEFYLPIKVTGIIVAALGAALLIAFLLFFVITEENLFLLLIWGILFLLGGGIYLWLYYGYYTRNKFFYEGKRALYECDENGLRQFPYDAYGRTGEYFIPFEQITKIKARKNLLVVFMGKEVLLLQRDSFTEGTENDFLTLLRHHGVLVKE